ncbi:hypothetical protein [Streptomyces sp. 142MFCol3.1]|uniref:hypothetical protein n=1 Tax=Streptomyces sp. 142MFCol3.1 TaxID=1172179 RepID=UPI00040B9CE1|nr:hypothetical protein [Streptomyces sp. 142MFCol3.1]
MSFALVNGSALVVHVLLACSTAELLATRVWRETSIGELTLLLQGSLLVWTAARYDRRADRGPAPHAYGEESR